MCLDYGKRKIADDINKRLMVKNRRIKDKVLGEGFYSCLSSFLFPLKSFI